MSIYSPDKESRKKSSRLGVGAFLLFITLFIAVSYFAVRFTIGFVQASRERTETVFLETLEPSIELAEDRDLFTQVIYQVAAEYEVPQMVLLNLAKYNADLNPTIGERRDVIGPFNISKGSVAEFQERFDIPGDPKDMRVNTRIAAAYLSHLHSLGYTWKETVYVYRYGGNFLEDWESDPIIQAVFP